MRIEETAVLGVRYNRHDNKRIRRKVGKYEIEGRLSNLALEFRTRDRLSDLGERLEKLERTKYISPETSHIVFGI